MKHTVKVVILLLVLTLVIISVSLYAQSYLSRTSIRLEESINVLETCIKAGDWAAVGNNLENTSAQWSKDKKSWAMLIDHIEIDNIDETLARMKEFIQTREVSSALAEASALKLYFRHIPAKDALSLENVF